MSRNIITTMDQLDEMVRFYSSVDEFVFDVETIGDNRSIALLAEVVWISFAAEGRSDTIPMGHPNGELLYERPMLSTKGKERMARGVKREELNPKYDFLKEMERKFEPPPEQLERWQVFQALSPVFFSGALKVGHNIKFDLHAVYKYFGDTHPPGPYYDTMIASWLLDVSKRGKLSLKDCVARECSITVEKGVGDNVALHPFSVVAEYSLIDAEVTWALKKALEKRSYRGGMEATKQYAWLLHLEMSLLEPVLEMEANGVQIDLDALCGLDEKIRTDLDTLRDLIYVDAARVFNLQSISAKQEVLFSRKSYGGKGLRPIKLVPSAEGKDAADLTIYDYSVDSETLEHYRDDHGIRMMLSYLAKNKIHNTYVLPYLGGFKVKGDGTQGTLVKSKLRDGRIYGRFQQHGTDSGRFSSSEPNLQNIPSRTPEGKLIRGVFIPTPGMTMIVADYSQIEPRIIAALSRDPTMLNTYKDGGDVYLAIADRMSLPRSSGKELVLSISYGVGADKIASRIGCSPVEARELLDFFSSKFPAIPSYKRKVVSRASKNLYAETVLGRRRPLPDLRSRNPSFRSGAERQAFNHRIQGTAADIMKVALVNLWADLPEGARLLMTVHDEVVVEAPPEIVEETIEVIRFSMETAAPSVIDVPLVADIHTGNNWLEGKG